MTHFRELASLYCALLCDCGRGDGLGFAGFDFRFRWSSGGPLLCSFRKRVFQEVTYKTSFSSLSGGAVRHLAPGREDDQKYVQITITSYRLKKTDLDRGCVFFVLRLPKARRGRVFIAYFIIIITLFYTPASRPLLSP